MIDDTCMESMMLLQLVPTTKYAVNYVCRVFRKLKNMILAEIKKSMKPEVCYHYFSQFIKQF